MKFRKYVLCLLLIISIATRFCIDAANDDYCMVLKQSLLFYKANRAGRLPDKDIPWRGNSTMGDSYPTGAKDANGDGNLSGGYFDAGDHVKFTLPMASSMTLLAWGYLVYEQNINSCGLTKIYLETIKWGTDWLIAAHISENQMVGQVGNGGTDHSYWGPPETMTMSRPSYVLSASSPGTEIAMEAAAALTVTSLIYKNKNSEYSDLCLKHAKQLYNFGEGYKGVYSDSITDAKNFYQSYSGYNDEVVWASIWLYKATGENAYINRAQSLYASAYIGSQGVGNAQDWDNKSPGCSLLLYMQTKNSQYQTDIEKTLDYWMPGGGVSYTPGGLAWLRQWGPNRYAMTMSFISRIYASTQPDTSTSKYTTFAQNQLNYVLGKNPKSQSFVVGYGPNHPVNPHHRSSHHSTTNDINNPVNNLYILYGALVGGPSLQDEYSDDRTNYISNEVALDYNAGFVGTLSSFASGNGEEPSSTSTSGGGGSEGLGATTSGGGGTSDDSQTTSKDNAGSTLDLNEILVVVLSTSLFVISSIYFLF
ncbi:cellulase [Tieghemostelium lacteum]|uniref:Endoglucanase n=1 Tax=Tieghemostelium lacteum TaxID=361077 RepID=A0A151ZF07_TIELA|nr:cellulase [Tieghemostelium lacteum]|eukprot:KYQ92546.1 cellulase [Tieghemostelium lacteum]